MKPVIINFVAAQSETGKTTILEKLIPRLKNRGLRIAVLKDNLRYYDLDTPGKDSWRFARAGAEIAGLTTPEGYLLIGSAGQENGTAAAARLLQNFDLILVEGNKKSPYPKIEVVRSDVNREPLLPSHTVAVLSDCDDLKVDLPILKIDDIDALAEFIEQRFFGSHPDSGMRAAGEPTGFTHFDRNGRPRMVDVSNKDATLREAYARGEIVMAPSTLARITAGEITKGDVFSVAQVAAIMAVKETGRLIPMAHPLGVSGVEVDFQPVEEENKIEIGVRVRLTGQTGVEMETLTGVSVAALTIYDMCKAVDKNMVIQNIRLIEKKGGRSGHYSREEI
ncbi:MAG: cyclic pyranopterin monophosphate synthase MoaC [Bacillota bacterium]|nr:cyclic pyranopterin monophosphate synthase MoaC [Bacillota bacterium]